jgi:hypothetical protein
VTLISRDELLVLDGAITDALERGNGDGLEILGYGEISAVVAWPSGDGRIASKRLPAFANRASYEAYRDSFGDYLRALAAGGIVVVDTELHAFELDGGRIIGHCIQPVLDGERLAVKIFARASEAERAALFVRIMNRIEEFVDGRHGLDAQLSNWIVAPDGICHYLDVSTPMLRDASGSEQLEADVFLSSLPFLLRPVVKRFFLEGILDKYYTFRGGVLDLIANLYKERLEHLVDPLVALANQRVVKPITVRELKAYYREDARTWAVLQRLRRFDRAWQRGVRRRPYPFLLPGRIER